MGLIEIRHCDGPNCENKTDLSKMCGPTYHQFIVGGSDFEMSFSGRRDFDFCCLECARNFIDKLIKKEL